MEKNNHSEAGAAKALKRPMIRLLDMIWDTDRFRLTPAGAEALRGEVYWKGRADALADGTLVDVSATAREAGFGYPVALTAALDADIRAVPDELDGVETYAGRVWDVLMMAHWAACRMIPRRGDDREFVYALTLHVGGGTTYSVRAVCGPGDDREPVITLMKSVEGGRYGGL